MRNPRSTPELLMRKFDQLGQKDVAWKAVAAEVRAKFFPKPPEPPIVVAPPPPPVVAPPATVTPSVPPVEPASNHRASAPRAGRQRHRRGSRPAASPAPNQRGDLLQDLIEELAAPHKGKPTVAVRGPMYADGGGQWGATVGVADLAISSGQNLAEQAERVISMLEGETRFLILDARKLSEAPPLKLTTQECVDRLTQSQSPELIGVATTTIVRLLEGSQALRHPNAVVPRAIYCRALLQLLPFAKGAVPNDRISRTIEEHRIDLTKVVEATRPQDRRRVLAGIELLRADSK